MILVDFLKGKRKLWEAWWLIFTLPRIIFSLILSLVPLSPLLTYGVLGLLLFFEIYGAISVWQCSDNCKNKGWGGVASTLIFIGPILSIAQLNGDNSNFYLNLFLKISLIGTGLMFLGWFFDKNIKSKKLKTYLMPFLIFFTYFFSFIGTIIGQETNAIEKQIVSIQEKLPIKLDNETELLKIDFEDNVVSYQYKLVHINAKNFKKNSIYKRMKESIPKKACNIYDTRSLLEKGINISYDYSDKNSLPLFKILITKKECEELRSE